METDFTGALHDSNGCNMNCTEINHITEEPYKWYLNGQDKYNFTHVFSLIYIRAIRSMVWDTLKLFIKIVRNLNE